MKRALCIFFSISIMTGCIGIVPGVSYPDIVNTSNDKIILLGDTQQTGLVELLFLFREQNHNERQNIVKAIAKENPGLLILLGDLVFNAESTSDWKYFDQLFLPVQEKKIPTLAVLGNHDYWGTNNIALQNIYLRFPQLARRHWYSRRYNHLGLIFLDSNIVELSAQEWETQLFWLKQTIKKMDKAPDIKGFLVLSHHPPYTNSKVTKDERHVQKSFVPIFAGSQKGLAYITGHAHGYEHFIKNQKHYIVSGGGGGPRVTLLTGTNKRHQDLYQKSSPRPFNFLLAQIKNHGIDINVKGFSKGETYKNLRILDTFTLFFNTAK